MPLTTLPAAPSPALRRDAATTAAPVGPAVRGATWASAALPPATATAGFAVPAPRTPLPTSLATPPATPLATPRSEPTRGRAGRTPEVVAREVAAHLAQASRYGLLPGQAGAAVPEQVRASLRELIDAAFPHLRAGTPDWRAAVALAAALAADVLGRYAVPLSALPSTTAPGAREAVAALSRGVDALLDDSGVGVVLDLDGGTAAFRVRTPAGATPSCGRAALLATCAVLLHLRLTQPLALAALVTEGGAWLPVWRAARDLWTVS
ncbi:hypothetical protein [Quadrisphaera sp. INWT6]|uniref:hypothetical protein n=1 Tax=Quadrisphaera sp. INWT6 TaxID=2596917 RepID=UPI0018925ED2|nr:hypothetical protein [Quadrisphaera sp. INWT6]MBF5081290.1 hypothetical protein [Quadrisphaera sp. INWT6]